MHTSDKFIVEGLLGQKKLSGTVRINGAKNAALKAMAASILFDGPVKLENVPDTDDIETMSEILRKLGARVVSMSDIDVRHRCVLIEANQVKSTVIDPGLAQTMRASVVLTGPLLGRFGKASFPAPGGCVIGARPIDLFMSGYEKMGAEVATENSSYEIAAKKPLQGAEIFFNFQTVGGTETLMMAAVLAKGTTILKNCALEPEIESVANWLNSCGANIRGAGTSTITIEGTNGKLLHASDKNLYVTIPDRIEAGSFLILGALCAKELTIEHCRPDHMEAVIKLLQGSGVDIQIIQAKSDDLNGLSGSLKIVNNSKHNSSFKPFNVRTHEYPGFPTDLQSPIVTYLTQTQGESVVLETIFEGRFKFVEDLAKMGANITMMNPREILVKGPTLFSKLPDHEELTAHDIRAGFAVVLAALVGNGTFTINNVHLIDRGYERLEERLSALGAKVRRVEG